MKPANPVSAEIRTAHLGQPFRYRTMEEIEQVKPSSGEQPHRHDYFVIIYIEKAEGFHHIDFNTQQIKYHTVYFVNPEQVHQLEEPCPYLKKYNNDLALHIYLVQYFLDFCVRN